MMDHYKNAIEKKISGDIAGAIEDCFMAINTAPEFTPSYYLYATLCKFEINDKVAQKIKGVLKHRADTYLLYAAAKYYDDIGDIDNAFECYVRAGKYMRGYNPAVTERVSNLVQQTFSKKIVTVKEFRPIPIFIVGLPRSGTTILEAMLSMHSDVFPAGEIDILKDDFSDYVSNKATNQTPATPTYLEHLSKLTDKPFIIDKSPYSYTAIPYINITYPGAPIIHIYRNPIDTLFSCFATRFDSGNDWTYTLEDLGHYYNLYKRTMKHWKGWEFLNVRYEDLVNTPKSELKRILEYCNLSWQETCLYPENAIHKIRTASAVQARSPIYTNSIGKAERYKKHLLPLKEYIKN